MKVVVLGASGLIGRGIVSRLESMGHEVVKGSTRTGVDLVTGRGLAQAFQGAQVVIDVSNSPTFEDKPSMEFFQATSNNVVLEAKNAGISHLIILSVVGSDHLIEMGYFKAKVLQEDKIKASKLPYTILRATQFFEFVPSIAQSGQQRGDTTRLSPCPFQPVAAKEVSERLANLACGPPLNKTVEIAGPLSMSLCKAAEIYYRAKGDVKEVIPDMTIKYFAVTLKGDELVPGKDAFLSNSTLEQWLAAS